MASNSSGALSPSQTYKLGDYTFRLIVTYLSDEDITSVQCHASNGSSNKQTGKDYQGHFQVTNWFVEAEPKTASVYVNKRTGGNLPHPIPAISGNTVSKWTNGDSIYCTVGSGISFGTKVGNSLRWNVVSSSPFIINRTIVHSDGSITKNTSSSSAITVEGKQVHVVTVYDPYSDLVSTNIPISDGSPNDYDLYSVVYGEIDAVNHLIARFEINTQDADAGNWDYPADTGEPSKTLHITVNGALSGRHNDPLNDTSYHYTPSDREQANVYGSGGVGGNGGAGGAGASTVVIYSCATDKAGYTEEIAIAKRHGYGSGAGKGGKGGDGCILVYY